MNLNAKQTKLLELLKELPPDLDRIEEYIIERNYNSEDLSIIGTAFVDICFEHEYDEKTGSYFKSVRYDKYVYEVVKLLLKYGLDPNAVFDGENIMLLLKYVKYDYIAADTLALLIEAGGDINLLIDGERLFDIIDFDVTFDALERYDRKAYDELVHYWMVLVGYGGRPKNGSTPLDVFEKYKDCAFGDVLRVEELKNHRKYSVFLSHVSNRGENWSLHIIDNTTLWEVARF